MARILRPWQDLVREKLHEVKDTLSPDTVEKIWNCLTNSYNSDGQWPPTLPNAPHIIYPFNYQYCFENLLEAELLVGGVDRSKLTSSPLTHIVVAPPMEMPCTTMSVVVLSLEKS